MIKLTDRQHAKIQRLKRYYHTADMEMLRYYVMTREQRAVYWIRQTLIVAAVLAFGIGMITLTFVAL
jgi:hypothetical protein